MKARLRRLLQTFLHLDDTPRRIALAFGVGVYLAFHPLLGLHTLLALGIAFAFRLSRAAMLVGLYVNNPWTIAPMYLAGTTLGCWILGVPMGGLRGIEWHLRSRAFYRQLFITLEPYVWPYVLGNTILGVVCGAAAYLGMRWILERRARRAAALKP